MNTSPTSSERYRMQKQRDKELDVMLNRYQKALGALKIYGRIVFGIGAFIAFFSLFGFFYDKDAINLGLITLPFGLALIIFSVAIMSFKNKYINYFGLIVFAALLIISCAYKLTFRASITSFYGIPVESYANINVLTFLIALGGLYVCIRLHLVIKEFDFLKTQEGYPLFNTRSDKAPDIYIPDNYNVRGVSQIPDTVSLSDAQPEEPGASAPAQWNEMETIDPISLDDE